MNQPFSKRFSEAAVFHFCSFVFFSVCFPPYSAFLYPLIAVARKIGGGIKGGPIRSICGAAWLAFIFFFCAFSYFFRYEYALVMNPLFFCFAAAAGAWAALYSFKGRYAPAYSPFFVMLAMNIAMADSKPFAYKLANGRPLELLSFIAISALALKLAGAKRRRVVAIVVAGVFFYTGSSVLPALVMIGGAAAVALAADRDLLKTYHPATHGVFAFHLLLIAAMAQFYSNSSPAPHRPPGCVNIIPVYGDRTHNIESLAKHDNRFLSFDATGKNLYFGARMSKPALFRLDAGGKAISSYNLENSSDNLLVHPDGRHVIAGSFGRHALENLDASDFRLINRRKLEFRPIRMRLDATASEVYAIGEFSGGSLFVYDAETLREKRRYVPTESDLNFRDIVLDSSAKKLLVTQWMDLVLYDSGTLKELSRTRVGNRGLGRLAIDPARRIVYLTATHSGNLLPFSYGAGGLIPLEPIPMGRGARDIAYDPVNNRLAIANYFSGELTIYSAGESKVLARISLGNRMRHVEFSSDGRRIATTTMAGGFIVDVEKCAREYKIRANIINNISRFIFYNPFRAVSSPKYFK